VALLAGLDTYVSSRADNLARYYANNRRREPEPPPGVAKPQS
jgi:hypothetical protein